MPSPHYKPGPEALESSVIKKLGNKVVIKPRALEIVWGGDHRYWDIPTSLEGTVKLKQVSWLQVTGSLDRIHFNDLVHFNGQQNNLKFKFKVSLAPDAFGWKDAPVYLMAKFGKYRSWKKYDFSLLKNDGNVYEVPQYPVLNFKVDNNAAPGDKIQFGMYEIWQGTWKGGLEIHEVVVEST